MSYHVQLEGLWCSSLLNRKNLRTWCEGNPIIWSPKRFLTLILCIHIHYVSLCLLRLVLLLALLPRLSPILRMHPDCTECNPFENENLCSFPFCHFCLYANFQFPSKRYNTADTHVYASCGCRIHSRQICKRAFDWTSFSWGGDHADLLRRWRQRLCDRFMLWI